MGPSGCIAQIFGQTFYLASWAAVFWGFPRYRENLPHSNKNCQPPSQGQVMLFPTGMVIWPLVLVLHWPEGHYTTTDTLTKFTQQTLMAAGKACLSWTLKFSWHLDMMPRVPWPWTLLLPYKEAPVSLSRVWWIHTYLMSLPKCHLYQITWRPKWISWLIWPSAQEI